MSIVNLDIVGILHENLSVILARYFKLGVYNL